MIIAVDTGGTKTLIAGFDQAGEMAVLAKFPTPAESAAYSQELLKHLQAIPPEQIDCLVIALPGMIENNIFMGGGNLAWHDFDLAGLLHSQFPAIPILLENDANLAGLSEARMLENPPARVLYVTISTGIGSGFVVDGRIDPTLRTSEVGLMRLFSEDSYKIYEDFASGKAIVSNYHELAQDINSDDEWRTIAGRIGAGFIAFLPVIRPDIVVIGGGVGTYFERFGGFLTDFIAGQLPENFRCPIVKAKHPEEAVVYGCYYYAVDHLAN